MKYILNEPKDIYKFCWKEHVCKYGRDEVRGNQQKGRPFMYKVRGATKGITIPKLSTAPEYSTKQREPQTFKVSREI